MKPAAPLLVLVALATSACTTMVNRRDLYSPTQASGPYSQALADGTWKKGVTVKPTKPGQAGNPAGGANQAH